MKLIMTGWDTTTARYIKLYCINSFLGVEFLDNYFYCLDIFLLEEFTRNFYFMGEVIFFIIILFLLLLSLS